MKRVRHAKSVKAELREKAKCEAKVAVSRRRCLRFLLRRLCRLRLHLGALPPPPSHEALTFRSRVLRACRFEASLEFWALQLPSMYAQKSHLECDFTSPVSTMFATETHPLFNSSGEIMNICPLALNSSCAAAALAVHTFHGLKCVRAHSMRREQG